MSSAAERIIEQVARSADLTEYELAVLLFGKEGYQQRVNSTCRCLVAGGTLIRRGQGWPLDPFRYALGRKKDEK